MDMLTGQELEKDLQSALDLADDTSSDVKKKSDEKELYTECIDNFSFSIIIKITYDTNTFNYGKEDNHETTACRSPCRTYGDTLVYRVQ